MVTTQSGKTMSRSYDMSVVRHVRLLPTVPYSHPEHYMYAFNSLNNALYALKLTHPLNRFQSQTHSVRDLYN